MVGYGCWWVAMDVCGPRLMSVDGDGCRCLAMDVGGDGVGGWL